MSSFLTQAAHVNRTLCGREAFAYSKVPTAHCSTRFRREVCLPFSRAKHALQYGFAKPQNSAKELESNRGSFVVSFWGLLVHVCLLAVSPNSLEAPCRLRTSHFLCLSVLSAVPYILVNKCPYKT